MSLSIAAAGWVTPGCERWECLTQPSMAVASIVGKDWFHADRYLGKRGHKYFSNATRYLLAAANKAIGSNDCRPDDLKDRTAVVVGTNKADYWVRRDMHSVVLTHGVDALNTIEAPNSAVNLPASYVAMHYGYTGPNLTLTNPNLAGLDSIYVADRLLRNHRLAAVMTGAVEDCIENQHATGGAAVLFLEKDSETSSPSLAKIDSIGIDFYPGTDRVLGERIVEKIRQKCMESSPIWILSHCAELARRTQGELQAELSVEVHDMSKINRWFAAKHTLLPVMQLLWLIANKHHGLVLAPNGFGQVVMFTLNPVKKEMQ